MEPDSSAAQEHAREALPCGRGQKHAARPVALASLTKQMLAGPTSPAQVWHNRYTETK
jgi:hypothetical protein